MPPMKLALPSQPGGAASNVKFNGIQEQSTHFCSSRFSPRLQYSQRQLDMNSSTFCSGVVEQFTLLIAGKKNEGEQIFHIRNDLLSERMGAREGRFHHLSVFKHTTAQKNR